VIVNILIGSSLLLFAGWNLAVTVMRRRPAQRFFLLQACLVGAIAMPILALAFAHLNLFWLKLPVYRSTATVRRQIPLAPPQASPARAAATGPARVDPLLVSAFLEKAAPPTVRRRSKMMAMPALNLARATPGRTSIVGSKLRPDWLWLWASIYACGACIPLLRLFASHQRLSGLVRRADPVFQPRIQKVIDRIRGQIGVRNFPSALHSSETDTPLAFGTKRGVIVLPSRWLETASKEEIESVLLHEYAHVDQKHGASIWLSVLAKAIYWPNPLVHLASYELCRSREEISDNYVLQLVPATQLARTLLNVAQTRTTTTTPLAAAGLFYPRWDLEKRVAGLLDPSRNRETHVTRFKMTTFHLSAAAVCATLAGVQLVHAQQKIVKIAQNGHVYILKATSKHPVTIQVKQKDGKITKLVIKSDTVIDGTPLKYQVADNAGKPHKVIVYSTSTSTSSGASPNIIVLPNNSATLKSLAGQTVEGLSQDSRTNRIMVIQAARPPLLKLNGQITGVTSQGITFALAKPSQQLDLQKSPPTAAMGNTESSQAVTMAPTQNPEVPSAQPVTPGITQTTAEGGTITATPGALTLSTSDAVAVSGVGATPATAPVPPIRVEVLPEPSAGAIVTVPQDPNSKQDAEARSLQDQVAKARAEEQALKNERLAAESEAQDQERKAHELQSVRAILADVTAKANLLSRAQAMQNHDDLRSLLEAAEQRAEKSGKKTTARKIRRLLKELSR
jgi:beta-lactamase regulating signal transducer with metallopeptidase domain